MSEFKKADEIPRKKNYVNVDTSMIDDAPTTRKERINLIMKTILEGEEKYGGYNLQAFAAKFTFVYGVQRNTIMGYLKTLENLGLIQIDFRFRLRPTEKGAAI